MGEPLADFAQVFQGPDAGRIYFGILGVIMAINVCCGAIHKAFKAWWYEPANMARVMHVFGKSVRTQKEAPDFESAMNEGPFHISELIGDSKSPAAVVAESQCVPALILAIVAGGIAQSTMPGPGGGYIIPFLNTMSFPIGLMQVIKTPYLQFVPKEIRAMQRTPTEIEMMSMNAWKTVHVNGFIIGLLIPLLLEFPSCVAWLWWFWALGGLAVEWTAYMKYMWLCLQGCRLFAIIFSCVSFGMFLHFMSAAENNIHVTARNIKTLATEFNLMHLASCSIVFSYVALLFLPGWPAISVAEIVVRMMLGAFAIFTFLKRVVLDEILNSGIAVVIHIPTFSRSLLWSKSDHSEKALNRLRNNYHGKLHAATELLSDKYLDFTRLVQSGVPDMNDELAGGAGGALRPDLAGGLGANHPKIRQLLVRPEWYETITAFDLHDLSEADLEHFGWNLATILRSLSVETIHFPYGSHFKYGRKMPFVRLSLEAYGDDIAKLNAVLATPAKKNSPPLRPKLKRSPTVEGYTPKSTRKGGKIRANTECAKPDADEVAFDITNKILIGPLAKLHNSEILIENVFANDGPAEGLGLARALVDALGSIIPGTRIPPPTDKARMHSMFDDPSPASYEAQIRGIRTTSPRIVLRLKEAMKGSVNASWGAVEQLECVAPLPRCITEPEGKPGNDKKLN